MAERGIENRQNRRFSLSLPVALRSASGGARTGAGRTRDVCAHSAFFYTDAAPQVGSELEFTFTLPAEITLTEGFLVHCKGKVVRVDAANGKIGVAALIRQYDLVPEA
ncbi:MAG: PilZ domain-containing protein [Terriglobales bacterium]